MDNQFDKVQRNYKRVSMDSMYGNLVNGKGDFLIRRGTECNELIFDGLHNVYATQNKNFPSNKIFLFNLVTRDVKKFLKTNPFIELPPKKDVTFYSYTYDLEDGSLTGTDLDHAYWRIAYAKGYISKKTYNYGLDDTAKPLRLATLSVLGREKVFEKWEKGEYVESITIKPKDEQLRMVYADIRYSCFYMMYELSKLLGKDFFCWKTDCIYYRNTPENIKIVQDYFDEREMLWKQLYYDNIDRSTEVDY
jgi:hypothetical protein